MKNENYDEAKATGPSVACTKPWDKASSKLLGPKFHRTLGTHEPICLSTKPPAHSR